MTKEEKSLYIFVAIADFIIGFLIGFITTDYTFRKVGISQTSYCKEIQVDTFQYDYQQDMYKYQIKLIK